MQRVEHLDRPLTDVDSVKAHGGKGGPDKFTKGKISGTNKSHLLWHLYATASQRTEQGHRVLIAKTIDPCGTISIHEGGFYQGTSRRSREMQW